MKVHMHTKFCFLCLVTFLFHQCSHCHEEGHHHHHHHHSEEDHSHDHSDYQISEAPYMHNSVDSPSDLSFETHNEAESEQKFYIEQLFLRYGEKGRLDFGGFEKLLNSLGLGEVRVVEMNHEEIGHDHVAHLDALEVQEGLHSHSHYHPFTPSNFHLHTNIQKENVTTARVIHSAQCKQSSHRVTTVENSTFKQNYTSLSNEGGKSSHKHHLHHHIHNNSTQHHHHHNHHHHHHHTHNDSEVHNNQEVTSFVHSSPTTTQVHLEFSESGTKKHRKKKKGIKNKNTTNSSVLLNQRMDKNESQDLRLYVEGPQVYHHDHDDGNEKDQNYEHNLDSAEQHLHVQKREISSDPAITTISIGGHRNEAHHHNECLNVTELLEYFGLSPDSLISQDQFTYLCPALLYQIDSRVCIKHNDQHEIQHQALKESVLSAWVWGLLSITVISLLSLLGVILVPIINQSCFKFLLTFLVALAVGTLSGDALLHLLPHSKGGHDHSHDGREQLNTEKKSDFLNEYDAVWKGLTALGGIYLLFIIEHCIGMFKHYREKGRQMCWYWKKEKSEEAQIGRKLSDHKLNRRSDAEWLHLKPLTGPDDSALSDDSKHNDTQLTELQDLSDSPSKRQLSAEEVTVKISDFSENEQNKQSVFPAKENGKKAKSKKHTHGHSHGHSHGISHGHSHHGHCHSDKEMKDAGIASIAWMVIMGDGMHNFSDGLAIGAAFSAGVTGGISTSVAVFCHELPHELGDFAVLLKAGMSVKQAIVYNLLSALMAYVGMVIGTAVGQYTHDVTLWIFAITAGMFLYVALVDMLPEMLHSESEDLKSWRMGHFLLQNLGMLIGFGIMLLIAIFEEKIVLDIPF
ncbi:zinc transporter ZIP10 isoform X2 [Erpetoichthys calabaricus]|uniref:zinc transporter ZIP10 isoform X2 n=1 Tax=Erpetoichthys calabaricus TaxID=27687 RepID=UPI0022340C57|nr:zinc transporter ZIP10 isoform X2 [Erpetoichthys calabaricus]